MSQMTRAFNYSCLAVMLVIGLLSAGHSQQLQSSQAQTLLRIQALLNYPPALASWNITTDFCNIEPNESLTLVCYGGSITQLHIIGNKGAPRLPNDFSIKSFTTTLVRLPNLKVLTLVCLGLWGPLPYKISRLSSLEIVNVSSNYLSGSIPREVSSLTGLQTVILDDNSFSGTLPDWLGLFPLLTVLSLRNNLFNGTLPTSLSKSENLRVLSLSHNHFYGKVPDLSDLNNLQVLDLEDNGFGPGFPQLGKKLITLVLSKNKFRSGIPAEVSSFYQLERFDISFNKFIGPLPTALFTLPSITYLNIEDNKLSGKLFENLSCNADLEFVDLSSNILTGSLPNCLVSNPEKKSVCLYARNCLETNNQNQHPLEFCHNEALAVGILPHRTNEEKHSKAKVVAGVVGGTFGGILTVALIFFLVKRVNERKTIKQMPTRSITENASIGYTSKLLSDARYISQTMKLGAVGIPAYRTFSLEELEEATNNFNTSSFMGEGYQGQMYRGQLKDGSFVAIRCLKMKKRHSTQNFTHHIELIAKLRHRHLVGALGHCFECYLEDSTVSRIFLVFEYVPNGTLRSWVSDERASQLLTWTQRIAASIGIAKGIQFLHTGIVPGVYSNNLKITDILLDYNLVAKISSYNLPLLAQNTEKGPVISWGGSKDLSSDQRMNCGDKVDIYDFGVILLEIIVGRPLKSRNEVEIFKNQIQAGVAADDESRRGMVDPAVQKTCLDQSLKTVMEVCTKCLLKEPTDRPSIEDVLWNLQFAAQVQEAWRVGSQTQSSEGSPISPQRIRITFRN
ncbi:hypothetical protein ACFE04_028710 [Oxalis oulophora]